MISKYFILDFDVFFTCEYSKNTFTFTAQIMEFPIRDDFFSKCNEIRTENFVTCVAFKTLQIVEQK